MDLATDQFTVAQGVGTLTSESTSSLMLHSTKPMTLATPVMTMFPY